MMLGDRLAMRFLREAAAACTGKVGATRLHGNWRRLLAARKALPGGLWQMLHLLAQGVPRKFFCDTMALS
jgi:hypothetical protein